MGFTEPYFNQPSRALFNNYNYNGSISNFRFTKKVIEVGFGFHFQTSGKHAVTHFIGPYFGIAQYNGTFQQTTNYYYTYGYSNPTPSIEHGFVMNRYYVMLDNGFLFRINKHFNATLIAGVGYHIDDYIANNPKNFSDPYSGYYNDFVFPINSFKLGLSMGYRF